MGRLGCRRRGDQSHRRREDQGLAKEPCHLLHIPGFG
jgi:hypothetical protein